MTASKAAYFKPGDVIDHTPSGAVTGGNPTEVILGVLGIPSSDIAAAASDSVLIGQVIKIVATVAVGNIGDNVWWDANGTPVGGTATGAATTSGAAGDQWLGTLALAHAAADTHAYVRLNTPNYEMPHFPGSIHEIKTGTYTVDVQDAGKVIHDLTDAAVITLPATATGVGMVVSFVNDAANGAAKLSISPNASDLIQGQDIGGTNNKDLINTKATAIRGDYVTLLGGHADGWNIVAKRGVWATEA